MRSELMQARQRVERSCHLMLMLPACRPYNPFHRLDPQPCWPWVLLDGRLLQRGACRCWVLANVGWPPAGLLWPLTVSPSECTGRWQYGGQGPAQQLARYAAAAAKSPHSSFSLNPPLPFLFPGLQRLLQPRQQWRLCRDEGGGEVCLACRPAHTYSSGHNHEMQCRPGLPLWPCSRVQGSATTAADGPARCRPRE